MTKKTAISETEKDKFGKLPMKNSKSRPTLIRGQCHNNMVRSGVNTNTSLISS